MKIVVVVDPQSVVAFDVQAIKTFRDRRAMVMQLLADDIDTIK